MRHPRARHPEISMALVSVSALPRIARGIGPQPSHDGSRTPSECGASEIPLFQRDLRPGLALLADSSLQPRLRSGRPLDFEAGSL